MTRLWKILTVAVVAAIVGRSNAAAQWLERSEELADSVEKYYRADKPWLLRENVGDARDFRADYLATSQGERAHSFLWPYSGMLSAIVAQYAAAPSRSRLRHIREFISRGLDQYLDTVRRPAAYASYTPMQPAPDRFYDDNIWIGIDFADLYALTHKREFLSRAEGVWRFVESGRDRVLGDGIYWCEQKKESKNTCSNAPAAVFALKLYASTRRPEYLAAGKELYAWTRRNLYDPAEHLYSDNISLGGKIGRAKFSYNSGQMLQAAALLYKHTGEDHYLLEADTLARACAGRFFKSSADGGKTVEFRDVWFDAVMMRGFVEYLAFRPAAEEYLEVYRQTLARLWSHSRDSRGLLDFTSTAGKGRAWWLLGECAAAEMMARLAAPTAAH